jgi:cytochrome P450
MSRTFFFVMNGESDGWMTRSQPKFMRDVLGIVTGMGLLTVTGNEHKMMRKTMNPAFSMPNLVAREFPFIVSDVTV